MNDIRSIPVDNLNKSELKILDYIYTHVDDVHSMSVQEFANTVNFSPSSIIRFCKKIGFSGFAELKFSLKAPNERSEPPVVENTNINRILSDLSYDIDGTMRVLNEGDIAKAVDLLTTTQSIHLFDSSGLTGVIVDYVEKYLFTIGRQNVYKYDAEHQLKHVVEKLNQNDLLLMISASGNFGPAFEIVKTAKFHNVKVLSITPFQKNNIAALSDVSLRFFTYQRKNINTDFTSRLPIFYVVNDLLQTYVASLQESEVHHDTNN